MKKEVVKMRRSEESEQINLIQWCKYNEHIYPGLELIHHIPNGGKRNKLEAARLKQAGVKAGVPDLHLPVPKGEYCGLYIEMKWNGNKPTPKQKMWIKKLREQRHCVVVCDGFEEAKYTIIKYMSIV
ncbi:VRR-NUC domain-containing protein [Paraclostridium sordellii]|uniref:VRR-NUC domain-containing protein n=2 Tax=Paraclostridium sordellii TaxID=1505 RepID=UPI00070B6EF8|nr:VRR-NUC domain-containing protein [Paeniclostridium sordellii]